MAIPKVAGAVASCVPALSSLGISLDRRVTLMIASRRRTLLDSIHMPHDQYQDYHHDILIETLVA